MMAASLISDLDTYRGEIKACRVCLDAPLKVALPHEPRPVLRVSATAKLLVASQAPGTKVHATGISFNDASGDRLRQWMNISRELFYDTSQVAIVPMGFCFPGQNAAKGDLPPRPECQATWHDGLFARMPQIETILAIGRYAQTYHFARNGRPLPKKITLDDVIRNWRDFVGEAPCIIPLPHPSWRNIGWLKRNPWFETEILPMLREVVAKAISKTDSTVSTRNPKF
jgi:uracil-DNA glycosylase